MSISAKVDALLIAQYHCAASWIRENPHTRQPGRVGLCPNAIALDRIVVVLRGNWPDPLHTPVAFRIDLIAVYGKDESDDLSKDELNVLCGLARLLRDEATKRAGRFRKQKGEES